MNGPKHSLSSHQAAGIDNPIGKGALYKCFFDQLVDELREKHKFTKAKGGTGKNWHTFNAGTSGFTYAAVFPLGGRIRAEVYIDLGNRERNVAALKALQTNELALSKAFAESLKWEVLESKQACRVAVYRSGSIEDPTELLREYRQWIIERLLLFKNVFGPKLPAAAEEAARTKSSTI
jgi:hypothetical protein